MEDDERDEFLARGGVGVLSLATDDGDAPHSVPVSYGYDPVETAFYFRLAAESGSRKDDASDRPVSFVTYGSVDDAWRSVVASGRLEPTTDDAIATDALAGFERVRIPFVDIFGRPPREVQFDFYRLVPESITGRKESPTTV